MKGFLKCMLGSLLAMFAVAGHAETVVGDKVNCRSAARTTAPVLGGAEAGSGPTGPVEIGRMELRRSCVAPRLLCEIRPFSVVDGANAALAS